MMITTRLDNISIERPSSLREALESIGTDPSNTAFYSGGSDLMPTLKHNGLSKSRLISISKLEELRHIDIQNQSHVKIGSQVTLHELIQHTNLRSLVPALAQTAQKIASPQIRNRASVGGNLLVNNRCTYFNQSELNRSALGHCYKAHGDVCHLVPNAKPGDLPLCRARFVSDLAPVFLLLGAHVKLASMQGTRELSLSDFYLGDGIERNQLKNDELLSHIEFSINKDQVIIYEKLRIRDTLEFPSLGVATSWQFTGKKLGIAITGLNPKPILYWTEETYHSNREAMLEHAIGECQKLAQPLKQDFFGPSYRKKMIAVFARRNFQKVLHHGH